MFHKCQMEICGDIVVGRGARLNGQRHMRPRPVCFKLCVNPLSSSPREARPQDSASWAAQDVLPSSRNPGFLFFKNMAYLAHAFRSIPGLA
jgi:hypothetical protein